jgi:glycosyltransferase involved in cell wall biosynthesis
VPRRVSIVVNNFNYERFLGRAIDSALSQTHPAVEVIAVDDGSSDGSRDLLLTYGDRIQPILKDNAGQASALNAGFAASTGEIVMFLDADDFLHPDAAAAVAGVWRAGCSKVQFRLAMVDEADTRVGAHPAVDVALPNGDVVAQLAAHGRYETPVTSGNAYPRRVLDVVMPIPEHEFRVAADGYLNAVVPFFGDVVSIDAELGGYRQHESSLWTISGDLTLEQVRARVEHDLLRQRYADATGRRRGRPMPAALVLRDWAHVLHRLVLLRLDATAVPSGGDTRGRLLPKGLRAVRRAPDLAGGERLYYAALMAFIAAAPRPLVGRAAGWALASRSRPRWLRAARRAMRRLRFARAAPQRA